MIESAYDESRSRREHCRLERVGVNNAVGCYFFLDDRQQSLRPCVWDNGSENLPAPLKQAETRPLSRMLLYFRFPLRVPPK